MSGELVPKLRVVRCPRCRVLLPEPSGCDLYKCGECGTTLLAKKRTSVAVSSESSIQESDAAPRNAVDVFSEGKQGNDGKHVVPPREDSLKAKAITTSSGHYHLDGNVGRGEKGVYNGDKLVPVILSDEGLETDLDTHKLLHRRHKVSSKGGSTSNKITHSEIEIYDGNLLEESKEELVCASDEDRSNDDPALISVQSQKEITECDLEGEELNNGNLSLEGAKDDSEGGDGNEDQPDLAGANPEVEITGSGSEEEELNNETLLLEGEEEESSLGLDGEYGNNEKSTLVGENLEVETTGSNMAREELNNGNLSLEGEQHAHVGKGSNNDQSAIEGAKSEVGTRESASTTKGSSGEKGSTLHITCGKLKDGTSANTVSSNKQHKQAQKKIHRVSDRARSLDTTEVIDHSSEFSGILGKLSKSPTTRSSYAYDGMDDHFPIQHSDSFDNTYTNANGVSEGRTGDGNNLVNSMLHRDLETQHQSHLPNAKHHVMKDRRGNQIKVMETTRHGHRRLMRTKRDEFPPKIPFRRSGSHSHYERGSSSNQMNDELYRSSSCIAPDSFEDTDQEKVKLLRMIHKLQDQLNRTRYMSGETNGRQYKGVSYKGNHISSYHNHDPHEGRRFSHGLDYPTCNGRCSHGINWHQRYNKFSQLPYSAEATNIAHHLDHSCYHCCSHERHFSADMSPNVLFHHQELHRSYPWQDWSSFSHPSSPQWFRVSKLPPVYGHEKRSDDMRHMAPGVRKYLREKRNLAKKHQRPVAGGAPFVTCPKCLKLLQLPPNFLHFKGACHKLKCGECSEVLKLSVLGSHIVSFSPNDAACPSSSDLHDQNEVISSSNNLPSTSHANYYHYSPAEPISYYDDYGLSFSKSYSSEGELVSLTQSNPLHEYDNSNVSHASFELITEKEKIAPRYSSTTKETNESTNFSSNLYGSRKLSSEMETRPTPKGSLHVLMGYSSPSQVIRGIRP